MDLDRRKVTKVQYSKLKVIESKSQLAKGEKGNKIIFDLNRRRAGLEQRKLKGLETKVLLGQSPGFVPSIKKVIIWDLLDQ